MSIRILIERTIDTDWMRENQRVSLQLEEKSFINMPDQCEVVDLRFWQENNYSFFCVIEFISVCEKIFAINAKRLR